MEQKVMPQICLHFLRLSLIRGYILPETFKKWEYPFPYIFTFLIYL